MTVEVSPPSPVKSVLYLCNNEFYLDPLQEMMADANTEEKFAILVVDGNGALFGTLQGNSQRVLQEITVDLPTGHRRGGQSQNRFARLRDEKVYRYLKQVAELAGQHYTKDGRPMVKGLVLAGPTDLKERLLGHGAFPRILASIVLKSMDLAHGGRRGFEQAVQESMEVIGSQRLKEEIQTLESFFASVARDTDTSCFSVRDTMEALSMGAAKTLIVSEALNVQCRELPDGTPDHESGRLAQQESGGVNLLDWLLDNYQNFGCELQIVSDQTTQGEQFCQGYGGLGAMLRWPIDFNDIFGYEEEQKLERAHDDDVEDELAWGPDLPNEMDDFFM